MKRTPLYDTYRDYDGVKLVDFGGWELPLHFAAGISGEHIAVRTRAGLFDVSHMGECVISGEEPRTTWSTSVPMPSPTSRWAVAAIR